MRDTIGTCEHNLKEGEAPASHGVGDYSFPVGTALRLRLGPFPSWSWGPFKESRGLRGTYSRTSFLGRFLRDRKVLEQRLSG